MKQIKIRIGQERHGKANHFVIVYYLNSDLNGHRRKEVGSSYKLCHRKYSSISVITLRTKFTALYINQHRLLKLLQIWISPPSLTPFLKKKKHHHKTTNQTNKNKNQKTKTKPKPNNNKPGHKLQWELNIVARCYFYKHYAGGKNCKWNMTQTPTIYILRHKAKLHRKVYVPQFIINARKLNVYGFKTFVFKNMFSKSGYSILT